MKVHPFGAAASPGCTNYGMKHLASQIKTEHPAAAYFIQKHFYVADSLISVESVEEACKLVKEAQAMCFKEIFIFINLSDSQKVLASIDVAEPATEIRNVELNIDILPTQRVLGVEWNTDIDTFSFRTSLMNKPTTRRGILSKVATIYDLLGFLSPFTMLRERVL